MADKKLRKNEKLQIDILDIDRIVFRFYAVQRIWLPNIERDEGCI